MADKTLTFALMDPPFENARSTTALRLIDIAIKKGYDVNVFAYEGAVYLPFALQKQHPNPVHGSSCRPRARRPSATRSRCWMPAAP